MSATRFFSLMGLAVFAFLGLVSLASAAPVPEDDEALRKKALALNDVTGDDPIRGEIKALLDDQASAKKLAAVAARMAKEKKQPFTYNGAFILANVAMRVKDLDASRTLFMVCAEQAGKVQSSQKLLQTYRGIGLLIELYYAERKFDKCAQLSQEFLEILQKQGVGGSYKAIVLRKLVQAMAKQGKRADADKIVDNLLKAQPKDWRNLELKGWLLWERARQDDAIKLYEEVIELIAKDKSIEQEERIEEDARVRLVLIDALYAAKKYDKSLQICKDLQESLNKMGVAPKDQGDVLRRMARNLARQGKIDDAVGVMERLPEGKEADLQDVELKAWLLREKGEYAEAAKAYESLLARISKEESLDKETRVEYQNDIHYMLSGVFVDMENIDKATEHLKILLAREPNNASYNNDLGYIWADHDRNLDEAEKMIRKALDEDRKERKKQGATAAADKDNSAYLDSLGWVLFKKKDFKEAKKYLLEAVKDKEGQHIEILDHLGDVHLALGEKSDAVAAWKKALGIEATGKREQQKKQQIEKKVKANR